MSVLILLTTTLLPAIFLWYYIWKQDPQPEPTNWLVKATLYGVAIVIPVMITETIIQLCIFGEEGPTSLLGTTIEDPYVGSISTFVLIYFCIKMHKFARAKILAQIERDRDN